MNFNSQWFRMGYGAFMRDVEKRGIVPCEDYIKSFTYKSEFTEGYKQGYTDYIDWLDELNMT